MVQRMNLCFDHDDCPDLLETPLKGKYLKELVAMLVEEAKAYDFCLKANSILLDSRGESYKIELLEKTQRSLDSGVKRMYQQLVARLSDDKVAQFGITLEDLPAIFRDVILTPQVDTIDEAARSIEAAAEEPTEYRVAAFSDAAESQIMLRLKQHFSKCLAVQEGRENDYINMLDKQYEAFGGALADMVHALQDQPLDYKNLEINQIVMLREMSDGYAMAAAGRASPVYNLLKHEYNLYSEKAAEFLAALVDAPNVDPTDKRKMKAAESQSEDACRKARGIGKAGGG
jgi:hypothetical protein